MTIQTEMNKTIADQVMLDLAIVNGYKYSDFLEIAKRINCVLYLEDSYDVVNAKIEKVLTALKKSGCWHAGKTFKSNHANQR